MSLIDILFDDFNRPDVPGAAVLVARDGEVRLARGYGLANLETRAPCAPETNFRLASVTKQFTALCVLLLAARGKLSLDDELPRFFPGFHRVTIRQLLTHTSGLPDYEELIPADTTAPVKDRDVLELLRGRERTYFPPGARFRYSNSGYALLALVVEAVSGMTFAEFLRRHVFAPLQMNNTVAYEAGVSDVPRRAMGYTRRGDVFELTDQSLTSAVLGDGGIYSSVADLFKWDQALYTEKLIGQSWLRQAFTDWGHGYGFGWFVEAGRLWHHGETCGFTTRIERFPDKRLSVIILANRREAQLSGIARKLANFAP